jgi:hypothetical protein
MEREVRRQRKTLSAPFSRFLFRISGVFRGNTLRLFFEFFGGALALRSLRFAVKSFFPLRFLLLKIPRLSLVFPRAASKS